MLQPIIRALRAAIMLASHTLIAAVILTLIWGLERYIQWLWGTSNVTLFDGLIPIKYLFHALDLGVMGVYVVCGILEAIQVFREE